MMSGYYQQAFRHVKIPDLPRKTAATVALRDAQVEVKRYQLALHRAEEDVIKLRTECLELQACLIHKREEVRHLRGMPPTVVEKQVPVDVVKAGRSTLAGILVVFILGTVLGLSIGSSNDKSNASITGRGVNYASSSGR